jgi:hypothetical protein
MERANWVTIGCALTIIATLIGCAWWITNNERAQARWVAHVAAIACHPGYSDPWSDPPQP